MGETCFSLGPAEAFLLDGQDARECGPMRLAALLAVTMCHRTRSSLGSVADPSAETTALDHRVASLLEVLDSKLSGHSVRNDLRSFREFRP